MTPRREKFCQIYVECGNASEAYRQAYPKSLSWKEKAVWDSGSKLLKIPEVSQRVEELQKTALERHSETVEDLLTQLEETRELAKELMKPEAMNSSIMNKAKLLGLVTDRKEHKISAKLEGQLTLADVLNGK